VRTSGLSSCQSQDNQWQHLWPYLPFLQIIWRQNLIVQFAPFDYGEKLICHISTGHFQSHEVKATSCGNICFAFYILFCKGLEMIGHDKIHTASCTYIHVMFLCHLHTFTGYLKNTNENFQKILSCAILLTTLHLEK
jgi:hypothetical protein